MTPLKLFKIFDLIRTSQLKLIEKYHPEDLMRCPIHFCLGQEALASALHFIFKKDDFVLSHHRSHAYYLAKNCPLDKMIYEFYGRAEGSSSGLTGSQELSYAYNNFHSGTILSGMFAISLGTAYAQKYLGKKGITFTVIGDVGMEEGICYETLNLASYHSLPIVFICENNKYSVHTRISERVKKNNFKQKANSFGVDYVKLKTTNILQMYQQVNKLTDKIRKKNAPIFIEFETMRYCGHVGPENDDEKFKYRIKDLAEWKNKDPIKLLEKKINISKINKIRSENEKLVEKIINDAKSKKFLDFNESLNFNFLKNYSSIVKEFKENNIKFDSSQLTTNIKAY